MPYFIAIHAKEGKTDELLSALKLVAKDAANEKGTLQYQVSQGQDDPRSIAIWEEYEDQAGHEAHREGSNFKTFKAKLSDLIDGELSIKKFESIAGFASK